ncbi:MAG: GNAT family N-acetyltransferase [Proteobacteria bacterium]|nr:GNAT family N-acetyltransferase [Pseudomonadota bacterium]
MTRTLETERLILRRPKAADLQPSMDFFMSDRAVGVGGPFTVGQAWRHFGYELGHWEIHGFGMWAVTLKTDDAILGLVGPWFPADWPEREMAWMMFENAEGKGIAQEAATAAIQHARTELGWTNFVSYIDKGITRSIALAERLGASLDASAKCPASHQSLVYRHPVGKAA